MIQVKRSRPTGRRVTTLRLAACVVVSYAVALPACRKEQSAAPAPAFPGPAPEGMVWIPGGTYWMGSDKGFPHESPTHEVAVDGFWMDTHEVTNAQFTKFVEATGHVTIAEIAPRPEDFPGAPPELLVPGSVAFDPPDHPVPLNDYSQWWKWKPGANWRHPEGPGSDIQDRMDHPVVHVAYDDVAAYAKWAGKQLPTEAQWEFAARDGLDRKMYVWGDARKHDAEKLTNIWEGAFPYENTKRDGYRTTAPVGSFPPNGFGLYDMAGNVWEWCRDWYRPDYYHDSPRDNPTGPEKKDSFDPSEPGVAKRVTRGGSFLCNDAYCAGYRPSARQASSPDTGLAHTGFRCVIVLPGP